MSDTMTILRSADNPPKRLAKVWTRKPDSSWQAARATKPYLFSWCEVPVANIEGVAEVISSCGPDAVIIRGAIHDDKRGETVLRRILENFGAGVTSGADTPHQWMMADFDEIDMPEWLDLFDDPESAVEWAIGEYLPAEFRDVTCFWQLSSSAGIKSGLSCHIWFWLDRPVRGSDLAAYFKAVAPAVDRALFSDVQMHFAADPVFDDGH